MKKLYSLLLLCALFLPLVSQAGIVGFQPDNTVRKGDVIEEDLYAIGENTTVAGDILGDLFAIGTSVLVGGGNIVENDALIAGFNVSLISTIKQDARIIGWTTLFSGKTGKDMAVIANQIRILPESVIGQDFIAGAGRVVLDGKVTRNVKIIAGEVELNDVVGGNVEITADKVIVGPKAVITGNFSYSSSQPATIDSSARVLGTTEFKSIDTRSRAQKILPTLWSTWMLINIIVLLLSALILHGVLREISNKFVLTSIKHFGWSLVRGFIILVAAPAAILLSFLTFVGIPFGILGITLYLSLCMVAVVYSPIIIGSIVMRLVSNAEGVQVNWKTIVLGVACVAVVSYVPYVGGLVKFVFVLVSLGSIYQVMFDKFQEVR